MNTNAVNFSIGADSSAFMRGMEQVKAIAKASTAQIAATIASTKIPAPDLAPVIARQKAIAASNAAMVADGERTRAKVTQSIAAVAEAYRKAAEAQFAGSGLRPKIHQGAVPPPMIAGMLAEQKAVREHKEKLTILLNEQAAAYEQAGRRRSYAMLDEGRVNRKVSATMMPGRPGQWDHLSGTQFEGGKRGAGSTAGGGRGNAYGLGVAYNAVQDVAQGGLPAIANNIPQIIELVAKSPALLTLGAAAAAAVTSFIAGASFYSNVYKNTEGEMEKDFIKNRLKNKQMADSRQIRREDAETLTDARGEGAELGNRQRDILNTDAAALQEVRRENVFAEEKRNLEAENRRQQINNIEDGSERATRAAQFERELLDQNHRARLDALKLEEAAAEKAAAAAISALSGIDAGLRALPSTALTAGDRATKLRLEGMKEGAEDRRDSALGTLRGVRRERADVERRGELIPGQKTLIDGAEKNAIIDDVQAKSDEREAEYKRKTEAAQRAGAKLLDDFFGTAERGMKHLADLGKIYEDAARKQKEQAKQKAQLEEQLEISELQAGGGSRKAKKMERARDLREDTEKYKAAGFSDTEAKSMAKREQKANDRAANPRSIRGAGFGGPDPDRVEGLDYFKGTKEERKMKGPETRNLLTPRAEGAKFGEPRKTLGMDETRGIPKVGGQVDKGAAEREAAEAKKAAENTGVSEMVKAFPQIPVLLKSILNALTGQPAAPDAATE